MIPTKLAPRERQLVVFAACLVALALLWWIALGPALQTYRNSDAEHAKLDTQIAAMQALAHEAQVLKAAPKVSAAQAQSWLEGHTKSLGKATLTAQAGRAQVSFSGASPEALAAWLADARRAVSLLPVQAKWNKAPGSGLWDGMLVFELPK